MAAIFVSMVMLLTASAVSAADVTPAQVTAFAGQVGNGSVVTLIATGPVQDNYLTGPVDIVISASGEEVTENSHYPNGMDLPFGGKSIQIDVKEGCLDKLQGAEVYVRSGSSQGISMPFGGVDTSLDVKGATRNNSAVILNMSANPGIYCGIIDVILRNNTGDFYRSRWRPDFPGGKCALVINVPQGFVADAASVGYYDIAGGSGEAQRQEVNDLPVVYVPDKEKNDIDLSTTLLAARSNLKSASDNLDKSSTYLAGKKQNLGYVLKYLDMTKKNLDNAETRLKCAKKQSLSNVQKESIAKTLRDIGYVRKHIYNIERDVNKIQGKQGKKLSYKERQALLNGACKQFADAGKDVKSAKYYLNSACSCSTKK